MTSLKDILLQLGFNPGAPSSAQQAFLKHLQAAAQQDQKAEILELDFNKLEENKSSEGFEQLSFDSTLLGNSGRPSKRTGTF